METFNELLQAKVPTTPPKPGYFRFLTLLAFHVFLNLKVNATVLEVGVGGTYDSTNVVPSPIVTGVTALGIDHVAVLGKTLQEIAWQKGGIYKVLSTLLTGEHIIPDLQPGECPCLFGRTTDRRNGGLTCKSVRTQSELTGTSALTNLTHLCL